MTQKDIEYLASNVSDVLGMPVRIYQNNDYSYFHYASNINKDPFILCENELLNDNKQIGYITTSDFFYYSYINVGDNKIIFGPFRLFRADDAILSKMALDLELPKDEIPSFISIMKSINSTSLDIVIKTIIILYFVLTGEKLLVKDILADENNSIDQDFHKDLNDETIDDSLSTYVNNSLAIEKELYRFIENGKIDELKEWLEHIPTIRSGMLSNEALRQTKNTFIVAATLASRAAIKGSMDPMQALALSDLYIQKMELLQNRKEIYTLQMNMIIDYTEKIAKIKSKDSASPLLISLNKYVLSHLSDAIKTDDLCDNLYISKSALFKKIKDETNMTISNYILKLKTNEALELLKYSNRSIGSISIYLGFSSQSHFNHAFKKFTGMTPLEYRNKK